MAKLKGPLMSQEARGSLGPGLTYSERKSGSQARIQQKQVIPKPSFASTDNQSLYRLIIARWNSFTQNQQDAYNEEVKTENLQISGWNLFVKKAMLDPLVYLGLAGYWTFNREGSGTVLDISKNGNHGTLQPDYPANAPTYVDSDNIKMRKALNFDGDDYIALPSAITLPTCRTITIYLKTLYLNTQTAFQLLGSPSPYPCLAIRMGVFAHDGTVEFLTRGTGDDAKVISSTAITDNHWHCITGVKTATKQSIYIDGKFENTSDANDEVIPEAKLTTPKIGDYNNNQYWRGCIDEVSVYNRALSAGEIKDIYNMYNVK